MDKEGVILTALLYRIQYRVKCKLVLDGVPFAAVPFSVSLSNITGESVVTVRIPGTTHTKTIRIRDLQLYLIPMDKMKPHQIEMLKSLRLKNNEFDVVNYLNKHHFDYNGLINQGVALDATGLNIY